MCENVFFLYFGPRCCLSDFGYNPFLIPIQFKIVSFNNMNIWLCVSMEMNNNILHNYSFQNSDCRMAMVKKREVREATPTKDTCHGQYFCSSARNYPLKFVFISSFAWWSKLGCSLPRMMKFKLREAMRSGKISPMMFDTDEGRIRQNLFLKDQREQRR